MSFLHNIDWQNHDGVNFGMINDFMRNQFYDKIISRYVQDQDCTDIGFGTGLLSMLAIKHGARHIRAFESDHDRYQLGQEIIKRLGLANKIELINQRYDHAMAATPVTFTETVNGNLWWEGLWNSLPKTANTVFLPGTYFLEIWALVVPQSFAQGLTVEHNGQRSFAPGVDVDPTFVQLVNELANANSISGCNLQQGIVKFQRQQQTAWGWVPYLRAVQAGTLVASYQTQQHSAHIEQFELRIPTAEWSQSTVLIVPRMGMQQDSDRLYLDTGHWGPGEDPVLLVQPQGILVVKHSVVNGIITYSLE